MKKEIADILIKKYTYPFSFTTAYESVSQASFVNIRIKDVNGNIGLGSAAPDFEVTGERIEDVENILHSKITQQFFTEPINHWYQYHQKLQDDLKGYPSAQSAVEEAILNLFSNQKKITLTNIFGGYRDSCPIMNTISLGTLSETVQSVKRRLSEGYKIIKLKCGINLDDDIKRIEAVLPLLSQDSALVCDANQGYTFDESISLIEKFKNAPIAVFEQPVDSGDLNALRKITQKSSIPIIADEAAVSVDDAYKLILGDYAHGINIKLMKCGGPVNFINIFHLAKKCKKIVMIGCMYESQISMTTGTALCLALPVDFVDLDSGALDFPMENVKGGAVVSSGNISYGTQKLTLFEA